MGQGNKQYYQDQQALVFNDGIYTNIEMVKCNCPLPPTWIEADMEANDRDFYKEITIADEIVFFDDNGVRSILFTDSIWGYSSNGNLHINVGGAFHKIDLFGRYSHFIALKTTYAPLNYLEGNRAMYSLPAVMLTLKYREYIVDIVNNKMWEFDLDGLESVLKKDPQLWDEFMILKKRERENLRYVFLKRYNEKYPLNIPVY